MIKVSVLYPKSEEGKFDFAYYSANHIPMVKERFGALCKAVDVERGLSGGAPGSAAPYVVLAHMSFDSVEDFQAAFAPHADEIMGDIKNYTNIQPIIQISEVSR